MKLIRPAAKLLVLVAGLALLSLAALAQSPLPSDPNASQRALPGGGRRFQNGGRWAGPNAMRPGMAMQNPARAAALASLTPEDRQRIRSARIAAMNDPAVRAAMANRQLDPRTFRMAVRDAMIKSDPSLAPTFQKVQQAVQQARGAQIEKFQKRLGFLSDDERSALMKSRQAVQNDPAVASARQQRDAATTAEARQQAERIYQATVQTAMIHTDARIGPILDKIRQQQVVPAPKASPAQPATPSPR
ncbi:hypothetical protein AYO41_02645 [Verrucomicrobia bacterium SCGC AG-212-E04]|nr:hypothetical protein AYO41_02645 [Verrucomicrobia bacterium SCGC AG-212-E04]